MVLSTTQGAKRLSLPYQLLQQPSAKVACGLCRGAQAVTAIYRRKGGLEGLSIQYHIMINSI